LSVAGRQEALTVWERAVQPLVFAMVLTRYGGASALEVARRASDVMANGQCFMLTRSMYDAIGGHESVRAYVAEDVMMAQAVWRHGGRVSLAIGHAQLSTRMYDGLASLVRGWSKNVFAGGRHAMRGGRLGQLIYPFALVGFPIMIVAPAAALLASVAVMASSGVTPQAVSWSSWSLLALAGIVLAAGYMNRFNGDPWRRGLLAPLGGVVLLVIVLVAVARGSRVRWKDRGYEAG
jgi:chlorobactene glucosyltransferase